MFSITRAGRQALAAWLAEPADEQIELRDPGLLRLFFAQHARDEDRRALVRTRLAVHRARLDGYLGLEQRLHGDVGYPRATLRRGIYAEEAAIRFWTELAEDLELVAPRKPVARGRRPGPGASGPRSDDAEPSPPA